ncbi:MAG: M23 family metallopeptidase [Spirochaetales bacterium]|nr:M23 family metallopeptidase [Spirochaetales bacterium]RKX85766.1 MAG: M23 family peptidase [Spirochaetota bacterium]
MSPVNRYKKIEKDFVGKIGRKSHHVKSRIGMFFTNFFQKGKQKFTVMFIPHSEKNIFNFQISVFTLIFFIFLLFVLLISFFGLTTHFTSTNREITSIAGSLSQNEVTLENFKEEISRLRKSMKLFKSQLDKVLVAMNPQEAKNYLEKSAGGDLSSFISLGNAGDDSLKELSELRSLRSYLDNALKPLAEIDKTLLSQKDLLVDIPTLWPLRGVRGNVTQYFGPNIHPFTGGWYLHKGIDIAWGYGVPIVATANGTVKLVGNDVNGFGLYIMIKHKYGFFTRYAHLQKIVVQKGQYVRRGQIIGYMGNTGLSTGPHLHYEVRIGTQVVDPLQFLNIESPLVDKYARKTR